MMEPEEQAFLARLPEEFIVFRGHQRHNRNGMAWTLSYTKAHWFANRFHVKNGKVVRGLVSKKDVLGVLLGRGEVEVVVRPGHVRDKAAVKKLRRPPWAKFLLDLAVQIWKV